MRGAAAVARVLVVGSLALEHQAPAGAVRLGDLLWSASDLRVVRHRNGDSTPQAVTREDLLRFGTGGCR